MITYSVETLYHFSCGECKKWWSIGDHQMNIGKALTCPHCGKQQALTEAEPWEPKND